MNTNRQAQTRTYARAHTYTSTQHTHAHTHTHPHKHANKDRTDNMGWRVTRRCASYCVAQSHTQTRGKVGSYQTQHILVHPHKEQRDKRIHVLAHQHVYRLLNAHNNAAAIVEINTETRPGASSTATCEEEEVRLHRPVSKRPIRSSLLSAKGKCG